MLCRNHLSCKVFGILWRTPHPHRKSCFGGYARLTKCNPTSGYHSATEIEDVHFTSKISDAIGHVCHPEQLFIEERFEKIQSWPQR